MTMLAKSIRIALLGTALAATSAVADSSSSEALLQNNHTSWPAKTAARYFDLRALMKQPAELFVELQLPSVAAAMKQAEKSGQAMDKRQEQTYAARIDQQQDAFRTRLSRLKMASSLQEIGHTRVVLNGISLWGGRGLVRELAAMPGVKRVSVLPQFHTSLETSGPWIGLPQAQALLGTGKHVRLGISDTGLDYTHADLGGSGTVLDYVNNDPDVIEPGTFPTGRVVGGFDFVGGQSDLCDVDNDGERGPIVPDPDPIDYNGHGTLVSSIAGGQGLPGVIGVGMAPEADIYIMKQAQDDGCGVIANVLSGFDFAADPNGDGSPDDHLDVLNMSWGSDLGTLDGASAQGAQALADLGVIMVASAGNGGEAPYVHGSPAVAPGVISVGASFPGNRMTFGITINSDDDAIAGPWLAAEGAGPVQLADTGTLMNDLVVADPLLACDPIGNAGEMKNKFALVSRGACTFDTKYRNAMDAGATAIVVFNDGADASRVNPIIMGGIGADITIPGVMISSTIGFAVKEAIEGGASVGATLDPDLRIPDPNTQLDDAIVSFSSRGPGNNGSSFKPDISAPGVAITGAGAGTGTGTYTASGTSFSGPHIAGLAALFKGANPGLTGEQFRALLQNTATTSLVGGPGTGLPFPVTKQGAGIVRPAYAASTTAYTLPGGVSFGRINSTGSATVTRSIQVHNMADSERTFQVFSTPTITWLTQAGPAGSSTNPFLPETGLNVSLPTSITVPANGMASFDVSMSLDAGPTVFTPGPGFPLTNLDLSSFGLLTGGSPTQTEVDGRIVVTDGTDTLQVPYFGVVDPASDIRVSMDAGGVSLDNQATPGGLVQGFTLAGVDGFLLDDQLAAIQGFGFRTTADGFVEFGLSTERAWEGVSQFYVEVDIDVDEDGNDDFSLQVADASIFFGGPESGLLVSALFDLNTGAPASQSAYIVAADHNDSSLVIPVPELQSGPNGGFLPDGDTTFDYTVITLNRSTFDQDFTFGSIDVSQQAKLGASTTFLQAGGRSIHVDTAGGPPPFFLFPNNTGGQQGGIPQ